MLDKIWHLRGSTHIGNASGEEALDRIETLLHKQRKPLTEDRVGYRAFQASLFENAFGPNWLSMVAYEKGAFWIEEDIQGCILKYDLRILYALIFCVAAAGIFFLFGFANDGVAGSARYATFAFLWLYGGNMLLAWIRIPEQYGKQLGLQANNHSLAPKSCRNASAPLRSLTFALSFRHDDRSARARTLR